MRSPSPVGWEHSYVPGSLLQRSYRSSLLHECENDLIRLLIQLRIETYPGNWKQVHALMITSRGALVTIDMHEDVFYSIWTKVDQSR